MRDMLWICGLALAFAATTGWTFRLWHGGYEYAAVYSTLAALCLGWLLLTYPTKKEDRRRW